MFQPYNMACTWNGTHGSCTAWPCDACASRKRDVRSWSSNVINIPITGNPLRAFEDEDNCIEVVARDTRTSGADVTADAIDNVELVNTLLFRCPDNMAAEDLTDKGRALLEALASRYGIPGGAELMQNLERIRKAHVAYAFDSEDDDMPGLE